MDFDPVTGRLWDTETGHWINDEINIVGPGFNSGYGIIQGLGVYFPAAPFALVNFNGSGRYNEPEFVWTKGSANRSKVSYIRKAGISIP